MTVTLTGPIDSGPENDEPPAVLERDDEVGPPLALAIGDFATARFGARWRGRSLKRLEEENETAIPLLIPWLAWTAIVDGERVAASFLRANRSRLTDHERDWFLAEERAWLSIWTVTDVAPGTIHLRDLLTEERRIVRDDHASRSLVAADTILAHIVDFRGTSYFSGLYGRSLSASDSEQVVRDVRSSLRARSGRIEPERLRNPKTGWKMIDGWRDALDRRDAIAATPPRITNTDGDELLFVSDTFRFIPQQRELIEARLSAIEGAEEPRKSGSGETEIVFLRGKTVVGRAVISSDTLRLETNSKERAGDLRKRVDASCAHLLGRPKRTTGPLAERRSEPIGLSDAEKSQMIRKVKEDHYQEWPDVPLPALGGKTPREASRSKRGREKLEVLLRDIERHENRASHTSRFDVRRLRQELGLSR